MREEDFRYVIGGWRVDRIPEAIPRGVELPSSPNQIVSVSGPRRAGKTYLLYHTIKRLLDVVPPSNILYVDFEHERLRNLDALDLETMLKVFYEMNSPKRDSPVYLFLDEVQGVRDWSKWVRRIHEQDRWVKLYVSGSSSKLLSGEISTELRGRSVDYVVLPFSFPEFLRAKRVELEDPRKLLYREERGLALSLLEEYLKYGGFPEVVLEGSPELKQRILASYYQAILYRDIIERNRVGDPLLLESFISQCVANHSKYVSISKLYNHLRGLGFHFRKSRLFDFLEYARTSYMLIPVEIFSHSIRRRSQFPKKMYTVDTGLIYASHADTNMGRLMENAVLVELARRSQFFTAYQVYYWKEYGRAQGLEVDFVLKRASKIEELIQVTYASDPGQIGRNETRAVEAASKELRCDKKTVITWDLYREDTGVTFKPLWLWLLESVDK